MRYLDLAQKALEEFATSPRQPSKLPQGPRPALPAQGCEKSEESLPNLPAVKDAELTQAPRKPWNPTPEDEATIYRAIEKDQGLPPGSVRLYTPQEFLRLFGDENP
jgi:hypothetical protein